jgi:hypothetical protein
LHREPDAPNKRPPGFPAAAIVLISKHARSDGRCQRTRHHALAAFRMLMERVISGKARNINSLLIGHLHLEF